MSHAQGLRQCLLCRLDAQSDEIVITVTDVKLSTDPLTLPYKEALCQRTPCFLCEIGPPADLVHLDCFKYLRQFHSRSDFTLKDIIKFWPRGASSIALSPRQKSRREKGSFISYLSHGHVGALASYVSDPDFRDLIGLILTLPPELRITIASFSWPCAIQKPLIVMVEAADDLEAYRKMPDPESYLEFPGSDVSFQRVFISGTSYIARFFRSGSASQTICRAPRKIVITRDIVGITDVEFHNEFEQCPPHQILGRSYWYKTIQPDAQLFKLHVHSQHIVTNIGLARDDGETEWDAYWDHPLTSSPQAWYTLAKSGSTPVFMRHVILDESTAGITISCESGGTVSIHAHKSGECMEIYDDIESRVPQGLVWIYFPLAKREIVSAGWVRELASSLNDRRPVVVLRTSLERVYSFGPYVDPNCQSQYKFQSLGSWLNCYVTGVCYNDMGIAASTDFKLGLTHAPKATDSTTIKPSFGPVARIPKRFPITDWFHSDASLEGIIRIRMCIDTQKPHFPCIGIVLVYSEREEALGQWRFDRDIEELVPSGSIYLREGRTEIGPFVERIVGDKPPVEENWEEIALTGRISWWFTSECSQVVVEEQT